MKILLDPADLRPLVEAVVSEVLQRLEADRAKIPDGRLAYTEPEAAERLGVRPHQLRDCRRRGEIVGSRIGKRVVYRRDELLDFLGRTQIR